jgi:hypothetical protein
VAASEATLKRVQQGGPNKPGHESDILEPTITVYPAANPNGAAVVVCPGGGYWFLSTINEGTGVCEWLNSIGVTGILLRYRTPTADETLPYKYPVEDLQRFQVPAADLLACRSSPQFVEMMQFQAILQFIPFIIHNFLVFIN